MPQILYGLPGALAKTPLGPEELIRRGKILAGWAAPDVGVVVRDVPTGPASIESAYEEYLSVPATAALFRDAEAEGFDVAILGCFGDPGLDAMREITRAMPVVGPGEAAFHLAAMLGERFGIVTVTHGIVGPLRHLVTRCGLAGSLSGIGVIEVGVLEMADGRDGTLAAVRERGRQLLAAGADVIVLGCMTMAFLDVTAELENDLGVPVVNPARAALHTAEMLARTGLRHSKRSYPAPRKLAVGSVARLEDLVI